MIIMLRSGFRFSGGSSGPCVKSGVSTDVVCVGGTSS